MFVLRSIFGNYFTKDILKFEWKIMIAFLVPLLDIQTSTKRIWRIQLFNIPFLRYERF